MDALNKLYKILKPSEIVDDVTSPEYKALSLTWSAQRNLQPKVIAIPESLSSLSRLIAFLSGTDLDFAIRCTGVGDASARDVLVTLGSFRGFEFNFEDESILIGAGQTWREVEAKLEVAAPGYQAVAARCSFVGVGGSIIHGGISWLGSEFGLASDPQNLLDAQVVKLDGSVVWALEEPDLLWALRGGGGLFGVVVAFKLKVYRYPQQIYTGMIKYPRSSLPKLASRVAGYASNIGRHPRTAMHLYCMDLTEGTFVGQKPEPGVAILIYDANGEEHGRGEQGFKWALDIEGAQDLTVVMPLKQVNQLADNIEASKGLAVVEMSAIAVKDVTEDMIMRIWSWFEGTIEAEPKLSGGTYVLLEIMQKACFQSVNKLDERTWPHAQNQHVLQLGIGRTDGQKYPSDVDASALEILMDAGRTIVGENHRSENYFPNFAQDFNDFSDIYGENYGRLMEVKKKYDPNGRLHKSARIVQPIIE